MITFGDLRDFFRTQEYKLIIAADGEPVVSTLKEGKVISETRAGGVSVALDPIARATNALYIGRAKSLEEKAALDKDGKMLVGDADGNYILKRLFFSEQDIDNYYYGFSNQTLWPLCHVAFEEPSWTDEWYRGYKKVNQAYANAIKEELVPGEKTFIWVNDYQLSLVPLLLNRPKDTIVGMFWHIPWPTWEVFRILPYKKDILTSLLSCDFLAFHRGYQARNFLDTVERELETRIDQETQKVHYNKKITTVKSLPMGIDVDVVRSLVRKEEEESGLAKAIREALGMEETKPHPLEWYFTKYKVLFGVDRLDYTKGIRHRLQTLDRFFEKNPEYIGRVVYLGIIAPSRESISSYQRVQNQAKNLAEQINKKYAKDDWHPIHLIHDTFRREDVVNFYHRADVCLVTPLDDGMNLVSKEFVVASSMSSDPGMLVLSQFAGSAIDLTQSLIVNPYNIDEVALAIKKALEMPKDEKIARVKHMADMLEEKNVYEWGIDFLKGTIQSVR